MAEKFIQTRALYEILEIEPFLILSALVLLTWVFYKVFLNNVSEERHRNIRSHLKHLFRHVIILVVLFVIYLGLQQIHDEWVGIGRILPYAALVTFFWGVLVFVKTCRLLVLQYLFMGSMQTGVPLLLVNIFSLALSVIILFWSVSHIFGLQLGPLLATSAAFSIILGLALQDTLGNLFAGISLAIDKAYEIGDWLEIVSGIQKTVGQVKEITWRSTVLGGFSDESITLPNRFMAQAQIANFSPRHGPIVRSQVFRLGLASDLSLAQAVIEQATYEIPEICRTPAPYSYISDTTESWISLKVLYFIDSYGAQFMIGDQVLRKGLEALHKAGVVLATTRLEIKMSPVIDHEAHNIK
jgi:small-conductance mechanosensitive channel